MRDAIASAFDLSYWPGGFPDGAMARPWAPEPHRLYTLREFMEIISVDAPLLCAIAGRLASVKELLRHNLAPSGESYRLMGAIVNEASELCDRISLPVTAAQIKRIKEKVSGGQLVTVADLPLLLSELHSRLLDELEAQAFFCIPSTQREHFDRCFLPTDTIDRFPSVQYDAVEAGKCHATGRDTACAFHLMRLLEVPIAVISKELGITSHSPTWNAYLDQMHKAIASKFPDKSKAHTSKREYYSGLEGQLRAIKDAWRNPTMHQIAKVYTDEMAREMIVLIRGFMREASIQLKEFP